MSFVLFVLWLGICVEVAADRISRISFYHPPPPTSLLPPTVFYFSILSTMPHSIQVTASYPSQFALSELPEETWIESRSVHFIPFLVEVQTNAGYIHATHAY